MSDTFSPAEAVLDRCVEDGGCLIWTGWKSSSGIPQLSVNGKRLSVRRFIWEQMGRRVPDGCRVGVTCKHPLCVEPSHLSARTRQQEMAGRVIPPATRNKIAIKRRQSSGMDMEQIRAIRASDLSAAELSEQMGLPKPYIYKVRSHAIWRDYSTPFAGLGAR